VRPPPPGRGLPQPVFLSGFINLGTTSYVYS
jgi:hypothetical protein